MKRLLVRLAKMHILCLSCCIFSCITPGITTAPCYSLNKQVNFVLLPMVRNLMIRLLPQAYPCSVALRQCLCNSHWGFVCCFFLPPPKLICWRAPAIIFRYSQDMTAGLCHPLHMLICSQCHTRRELPALDPGKVTGKLLVLGAARLVGLPWWSTLCSKV